MTLGAVPNIGALFPAVIFLNPFARSFRTRTDRSLLRTILAPIIEEAGNLRACIGFLGSLACSTVVHNAYLIMSERAFSVLQRKAVSSFRESAASHALTFR